MYEYRGFSQCETELNVHVHVGTQLSDKSFTFNHKEVKHISAEVEEVFR